MHSRFITRPSCTLKAFTSLSLRQGQLILAANTIEWPNELTQKL